MRPIKIIPFTMAFCFFLRHDAFAIQPPTSFQIDSLPKESIAKVLGWIPSEDTRCGGYYLEAPITYPERLLQNNAIQITSDQGLFALHGTSIGKEVTITRYGQQIIASKAYIYRDPQTKELSAIDLMGEVKLREPNSLVIAKKGRYTIKTKAETLHDILYRTAIYGETHTKPTLLTNRELQEERRVYQLSAWGNAQDFTQDAPRIYNFEQASFSTCPPQAMVWQVKASHLTLNKESGRGYATHARVLVKGIPIFYTPYFNFPIDNRRKTGFLWPTFGSNSRFGPYFTAPFYWNLAPNYDMTITPAILSKRGIQIADSFRYLTPSTSGKLNLEVLPNDAAFALFQEATEEEFKNSTSPVKQSELRRLEQASTTRKSVSWVNSTQINEHWSSDVNYNWVSDDYYLRNFTTNINQVTQNQLLQQADLNYKGQNWNFTGRVQGYQTLHPVNENVVFYNQYTRLPQLVFNGSYPDTPGGFEYFVGSDFSHFDIRNNPGVDTKYPMGNRYYVQPGISRPINLPYLTLIPRLQFSMTQYSIGDVMNGNPKDPSRTLPIFDVNSTLYFDREASLFGKRVRQTLEPRLYYTYIPFRDQSDLPIFDTTVNTLTYDQLFVYNRFSGLDRINDANQVAGGVTTRLIDQKTGEEKLRASLGQIFYFKHRRVTLCTNLSDPTCPPGSGDTPNSEANLLNKSPLTGLLTYTITPNWLLSATSIWSAQTNQLDNQNIYLSFNEPIIGRSKTATFGYNFVRNGDRFPNEELNSLAANLSQTDFSTSWPLSRDWSVLGRWTQNWNHHHFQNLLYGLQYDSCCWAVRLVAGRVFVGLTPQNTFQYNTQFYIQFALKGLGNVGTADPGLLLSSSIGGYQNTFGRDF